MEAVIFVCSHCVHYDRVYSKCKAFPKGIPDEIISGQERHINKIPGQTGDLVWESAEPGTFKTIDQLEKLIASDV